jgi:ubiquinone/menaquinone biosynthesis C-methylase UbiE
MVQDRGRAPRKVLVKAILRALSNAAYGLMVAEYAVQDFLVRGFEKVLDGFAIHPGWTVVDYGCGPGRYLRKASALVGPRGRVYAADVSEVAMGMVRDRIARKELRNVVAMQIEGGKSRIPSACADLVYALDMFHAVRDPSAFLREIRRIVKPAGRLILEDGHQPRAFTLRKVAASGAWKVIGQSGLAVTCAPVPARRGR